MLREDEVLDADLSSLLVDEPWKARVRIVVKKVRFISSIGSNYYVFTILSTARSP